MKTPVIYARALNEKKRAEKLFPKWPANIIHAYQIVNEEIGETNKAILQTVYEPEKSSINDVKVEVIQSIAMLFRFMNYIDEYELDSKFIKQVLNTDNS
jgi:hypothetical protein